MASEPSRPNEASALWTKILDEIADEIGAVDERAPEDVMHALTRRGDYTYAERPDSADYQDIVSDYIAWLDENGTPLDGLPEAMSESTLIAPELRIDRRGRRVSTMFLFHLCIAQRLLPHLPEKPRILEIGGGYGGLARVMRLLVPDCEYTIVDLPQSLQFSALFLRESFQETPQIVDPDTLQTSTDRPPFFEFLGSDETDRLKGRGFDIAINTCSFGEMSQAQVDAYHQLIEIDLDVPLWYSINRFGYREFGDRSKQASRDAGTADTSGITLHPASFWDPLIWDLWNETGFGEIEIAAAPYLEILLRRVSKNENSSTARREKAAALVHSARNQLENSNQWHYAYFNALRYFPTDDIKTAYCSELRAREWPEADYFKALETEAAILPLPENQTVIPKRATKVLFANLSFTKLNRTFRRRLRQQHDQFMNSLTSTQDENRILRKAIEETEQSNRSMTNDIEDLAAANKRLSEETESLALANKQLRDEADSLTASNKQLRKKTEHLTAEKQRLADEVESITARNEELISRIAALESARSSAETATAVAQDTEAQLDNDRKHLKIRYDLLRREAAGVARSNRRLSALIDSENRLNQIIRFLNET